MRQVALLKEKRIRIEGLREFEYHVVNNGHTVLMDTGEFASMLEFLRHLGLQVETRDATTTTTITGKERR